MENNNLTRVSYIYIFISIVNITNFLYNKVM